MRVELITAMGCYDIEVCNALGRNESSNRKRLSLLISVYSTLLLLHVWGSLGISVVDTRIWVGGPCIKSARSSKFIQGCLIKRMINVTCIEFVPLLHLISGDNFSGVGDN